MAFTDPATSAEGRLSVMAREGGLLENKMGDNKVKNSSMICIIIAPRCSKNYKKPVCKRLLLM
jgi:hypothetical protein